MCNAYQHPPGCDCGFGGGGWGGGWGGGRNQLLSSVFSDREDAIGQQPYEIWSAETREIACWWCGAKPVFYHTNGYGDSVLFDSLGAPWQIHHCWQEYWTEQKRLKNSPRSGTSGSLADTNDRKMAILAGAIRFSKKLMPTEFSVAAHMGITLGQLRTGYRDLYTVDRATKGIKLKNIEEVRALEQQEKEEEGRSPKEREGEKSKQKILIIPRKKKGVQAEEPADGERLKKWAESLKVKPRKK